MGLYRWNSGGQYRGKLWEQDLLADSQVCNGSFYSKPLHLLPPPPPFPPSREFTDGSIGRRLSERGKAAEKSAGKHNV